MRFNWKISKAGNSGVKYRIQARHGFEYQILDDQRHKDGVSPNHRAGALYDLVAPPENKRLNPVGEWNQAIIKAKGNHIEHWLNGQKIVEIEYGSTDWLKRFKESKFKKIKDYGAWSGPIMLQDHGDEVWFKNVRIREL